MSTITRSDEKLRTQLLVTSDTAIEVPEELKTTLERFAKTKLEENEPFYRSVAGRLKDRKLGGPYICDKDGLEERIRTAIDQGEVLKAKRRYSVGREAGDSLVQFATSLHGMLAGYTDMIAVINGAVPRFGPLAYGTLSTLLLVGSHKSRREETIMNTLKELANTMPRMRMYDTIHKGNRRMWPHLVELYTAAILFPLAAIKYYEQSTIGRISDAIAKPVLLVKELSERVKRITQAVTDEAVASMSEQINSLIVDVKDTRNQMHQLMNEQHRVRVQNLLQSLTLTERDYGPFFLSDLTGLLKDVFTTAPKIRGTVRKLEELTVEKLEELPQYNTWMNSLQSSLLVLSGSNYDTHYNRGGLCWLSSAIPAVATKVSPECPRAFYSARRSDRSSRGSANAAFSTVLLQIMEANADLCLKLFSSIQSKAANGNWKDMAIRELTVCVIDLVKASSNETFYLLFDRIDLLDMPPRDFIIELVKIIKVCRKEGQIVKILATAETAGWRDVESNLANNDGGPIRSAAGLEEGELLLKLKWDQSVKDDW